MEFCYILQIALLKATKLDVIASSHLNPKIERLYEHVNGCVLFESDVPDELDLGERRVVRGVSVGDVDAVALECHRHEVWNADDESDEVDEHNRQLGATDAAPDCSVTWIPYKQVSATTRTTRFSVKFAL